MTRRIPEPLRAELDRAGTYGRIEHKSRHPRLIFRWRGREIHLVIPGTPSDWRAGLNSRAALRRILRGGR